MRINWINVVVDCGIGAALLILFGIPILGILGIIPREIGTSAIHILIGLFIVVVGGGLILMFTITLLGSIFEHILTNWFMEDKK